MEQDEIDTHIAGINKLTQEEMCRLWRNAPHGHPYFDSTLPLYAIFKKRFGDFGGFTPEISKKIGWDDV